MSQKYFSVTLTLTVSSEHDEPSHAEIVEELQSRIKDDHIDCCLETEDITEDYEDCAD